eukprot:2308133-Prymnesium_polylepis.2
MRRTQRRPRIRREGWRESVWHHPKEATHQRGGLEGESAGLRKLLGRWGSALRSAWDGARAARSHGGAQWTALACELRGGGGHGWEADRLADIRLDRNEENEDHVDL